MRSNKPSLASLRTVVLYLPVLMFVAFLALVVVPGQSDDPLPPQTRQTQQ